MQSCTGRGFADALVEQAVIGVGQAAVRLEPGRFALRKNGGQARVLRHHEAPSERFTHQANRSQRAQGVFIQAQQHHGTAAKPLVQRVHQALQAHGVREFSDQVRQQGFFHHGGQYRQGF